MESDDMNMLDWIKSGERKKANKANHEQFLAEREKQQKEADAREEANRYDKRSLLDLERQKAADAIQKQLEKYAANISLASHGSSMGYVRPDSSNGVWSDGSGVLPGGKVQPYQPLGGFSPTSHDEYIRRVTEMKKYSDQMKQYPPRAHPIKGEDAIQFFEDFFKQKNDQAEKANEEAKKLVAGHFDKDRIAQQVHTETGKAPQCIYISATEGHAVEIHTGGDHFWLTMTDDDGNAMRVRMPRAEFERMLRAEEESKVKPG